MTRATANASMVVAYRAWLRAAGPWRLWSACLPLLGPCQRELTPAIERPVLAPHATRMAEILHPCLAAQPTLALLDGPPVVGVETASILTGRGVARPLLLLGRFPHRLAVLPTAPLLAALIAHAPVRPARRLSRSASVVVVLDAESMPVIQDRSPRDPRADNRFRLLPEDLPDLETLRRAGIQRVVHVTFSGLVPCLPASYLADLQAAGLAILALQVP